MEEAEKSNAGATRLTLRSGLAQAPKLVEQAEMTRTGVNKPPTFCDSFRKLDEELVTIALNVLVCIARRKDRVRGRVMA